MGSWGAPTFREEERPSEEVLTQVFEQPTSARAWPELCPATMTRRAQVVHGQACRVRRSGPHSGSRWVGGDDDRGAAAPAPRRQRARPCTPRRARASARTARPCSTAYCGLRRRQAPRCGQPPGPGTRCLRPRQEERRRSSHASPAQRRRAEVGELVAAQHDAGNHVAHCHGVGCGQPMNLERPSEVDWMLHEESCICPCTGCARMRALLMRAYAQTVKAVVPMRPLSR